MRTLILTLLIVLLPWRAWVGEAMAAGFMPSQAPPSMSSVYASQPSAAAAAQASQQEDHAPQPCHGHTDHSRAGLAPSEPLAVTASDPVLASTDNGQDQTSSSSCSNCGNCDMCHSVALLRELYAPVHPGLPNFSWPLGHSPFASAITAPGHKPPIA